MKRILLSLTAIFVVMTIAARTQLPRTVQGVPYTPKAADGKLRAASDWEWATPDDMAGDANFTFDMIKNWTGEGENKAALVIQWNYDDEPAALVFGYRWTGQATGADMLKAVVKNNPRLYALMQYTNVSSPTDPNGGYTINGIGWDVDDDGDIALIDTGNGNQVYESEDGFFEHPHGYKPGQGGSSDYDYDNWKARDTDDMWGAGWYSSYWSYWVKDNAKDKFSYSSWGASGRVLENGSWDGWNFAAGMSPHDWKSFVAAPLPIPADAKTVFVNEGLRYELKSYSAKTVKLTAPETGVYTGEVAVPSTFVDEGVTYTVVEVDKNAFANSTVTTVTLPATVTAIGKEAFKNSTIATLNVPSVDGVTKIGDGAFFGCSNFATLFVPSSMTSIPDSMFEGTAIADIKFPAHVEAVGKRAFAACQQLAGVEIPATITAIGDEAFAESNAITSLIKEFTMPAAMTEIPNSLFAGCVGLTTLKIGKSVNAIKGYAFDGCKMLANIVYADGQTGVNLPSTLTSIEAYAFRGCNAVGTLVLPEALASLPSYAFENSGLNRLVLPQKKMNYSNTNLVYGCKDIKVYSPVTEPGTTGSYTWRVKNGSPATFAEIVVPAGCESAYSSIYYWGKSKLTALQLEGIQLVEGSAKKVGGNLVISGRIAGTYDDAHAPAAFTQFNDGVLFKGKTVKVVCKMTSATLDIAKAASMTETTVGDDATFTVTMPDTENADMLRLIVQYEDNGSTYTAGYPEMINVEKTFAFTDAEYDAHFDESFTPTLEFYSDAYSLDKIEFSSSDTKVASVNKRTGAVSVKRVEGDAVITAALKTDPAVKATMTVHAALRNPVTGFVLGNGDKTINLTYLDILALSPTVEPANADIQTYDVSVSDPEVATTYAARAFNPSRSFWELITHKTGTVDVTFTSQDGSGASTTYTVNVLEPNREPLADSYQDGTFWLNEDWFGHSNGSINYIADNGELKYRVYESQNKYESFGCTSQYGIIYGDKLIVMSKQATDGGDPRKGGGRVVVADAKTLKKLAAFDYIGADTDGDGNGDGDGRACVGVSENKVYLGSTAGIQVLDTRTLTLGGMVDGIASGENKYNGQIGDMVAIGKYAFAIQQGVGVHVIDIATDKVVKTFPVESDDASGVSGMGYPQGITVTADGNVWVATTAGASKGLCTFRCIDPNTLDVTDSVELPEGQRVTCGWGAWRSTNFFASKGENAIWYGAGVEASIVSGNTGYYKWTVGSDIAGIQPVFVFPNNLPGVDSKTFQAPYAGVRYDDRKNQLLVAATHGASSNYRYNWLHFVDCKTGDIVKTIKLKDYYWFPSMPIFPDKYAPEFSDLPEVSVDLAKDGDIFTIDLKDYVTDKDNIDAAIRLSIVGGDAVAADNTVSDKSLVNATLENGVLTITPLIAGHGNLNVKAESNGKTTTVSIPYAVEDSASGIHNVDGAAGTLSVCDNIVTVKNMAGTTFAVYDMAGRVVGAFVADSDCARVALTLPSGVYVVASTNGSHTLKFSIQ